MNKYDRQGSKAKKASVKLQKMGQDDKVRALEYIADSLVKNSEYIIEQNKVDIKLSVQAGVKESLIDRLTLTQSRIEDIADGIKKVAKLNDPIGEITSMVVRPNGLEIGKKRVPLGVVGVIYESRPNVTADVFALCFKTSNAVILKGGSDALNSNKAIVDLIRESLEHLNIDPDCIILIEDTDKESVAEFMRLDEYVDVLIPRGGKGLIQATKKQSTIPIIETGTGNCHVYVDKYADIDMAVSIIDNAKTSRYGVCNACESLVIHKEIADEAIPRICETLEKKGVEIRGDELAKKIYNNIKLATKEDWGTEYLDKIISIKVVENIEEAIEHINNYNTKHSEAIITENYNNANKFLNEIDASAVYVNASTRFTDGFEFGFGAEIGISTQKLHARGPMGLEALTSYKYVILGNGQIR